MGRKKIYFYNFDRNSIFFFLSIRIVFNEYIRSFVPGKCPISQSPFSWNRYQLLGANSWVSNLMNFVLRKFFSPFLFVCSSLLLLVLLFFFPFYFYPRTRNRGSNWRSLPGCKVDRVTRIELLTKLVSLSGYELLSLVTHEWNLFVWIFSSCPSSSPLSLQFNGKLAKRTRTVLDIKRSKNCNRVHFIPLRK